MKNKGKVISIYINEKDYKKLRSQAFKNEVSLSFFVREKLGIEEKKDNIVSKSVEEKNILDEEKAKKIEELQRLELEKEQANFFNSSNNFDSL